MKKLWNAIAVALLVIASTLMFLTSMMYGAEIDYGPVIVDKHPTSVWWEKKDTTYILVAKFNECEIRTYFDKKPKGNFFISRKNKPITQSFVHSSGIQKDPFASHIEHFADGARTCCFKYKDVVYKDEKCALTVTIINETNKDKPDVRYVLYRLAE